MKITKTKIIIGLIVLILVVGGYWFLNQSSSNNNVNPQRNTTNTNSFFPLTAVKNIISTVTSNLTSSTTDGLISGLFDQEDKVNDFDILRAVKLTAGPVEDYGFIPIKNSSTTLYYFNNSSNIIGFIPDDATSTNNTNISTSSVIKSPDDSQTLATKVTADGLEIYITNLKSKLTTKVLTSPLTDWLISWPEINTFNLQTRPASGIDGFTYTFNLKTKEMSKILGPILGLNSLLSPDGKNVIYSSSQNGQIKTYLKTVSKESGDELSIKTLVDKCIWYNTRYVICAVSDNYPTTNYPNAWYQGLMSFNDNIWIVDSQYLESYLISIFGKSLADEPIDAINLKISPDKSTLYFINKIDRSLWSFDLTHAF